LAGTLELVSQDVIHDINQGGREIGKAKFRAFLEHMECCYREQLEDIVVLSDLSGNGSPRNSWSSEPI